MCSHQYARISLVAVMALALMGCPRTATWTKVFGGTDDEQIYGVVAASDGGFLLAGRTWSFGAGKADIYAVKVDSAGAAEWINTYGGTGSDMAFSAIATSDGGYLFAGGTHPLGSVDVDMYAVKIDASGTTEWSNAYGGAEHDEAFSVIATSDGGYLFSGWSYASHHRMFVVYTNASGVQQWSSTVGSPNFSRARSAVEASDGGYLIVGETVPADTGGLDVLAVKVNDSGEPQWSNTYGGPGLHQCYGVVGTSDGGYLLAGETNPAIPPVYAEVYLVKISSTGELQWSKTFGATGYSYGARSLMATSDGGYLMAGFHHVSGTAGDLYVLKTDASGNGLWANHFGGYKSENAMAAVEADDGGFVLAGQTNSYYLDPSPLVASYDAYVVKIDATGHGSSEPTP